MQFLWLVVHTAGVIVGQASVPQVASYANKGPLLLDPKVPDAYQMPASCLPVVYQLHTVSGPKFALQAASGPKFALHAAY